MPCEYWSPHEKVAPTWRDELLELTPLVCALCKIVEGRGMAGWIDEAGLRDWWEEHKRRDAERERREQQKRERERLREEALAKLSQAEREALDA